MCPSLTFEIKLKPLSIFAGGFYQPVKGVGRSIAGGWWFLVLVVYGIYTGNLIAFLTVTELKLPFNSLQEMAQQSQYKYGAESGIIQLQVFQVR